MSFRSPAHWFPMVQAASVGLLALTSVTAFPGARLSDLHRPLPEDAFRPRMMQDREALEGYSLWLQTEDGYTILISLLISNLGRTHQPALHATVYPPSGSSIEAHEEFAPAKLQQGPRFLAFGRNRLEQSPDGEYRLRIAVPLERSEGELTADLHLEPNLPPLRRGDGRIHYGNQGKFFELTALAPRAKVHGHFTHQGKVVPVTGSGYLDHTAQNLYPHQVASRWINYRFFSPELYMACTSLVTPASYGGLPVSHVLVANHREPLYSAGTQELRLLNPKLDPVSGYEVPQRLQVILDREEPRVSFNAPLEPRLDRLDLLEDLNIVLRTLIKTFISRPYTYRYRVPTVATVSHRDGRVEEVKGMLVVEIIYVNEH